MEVVVAVVEMVAEVIAVDGGGVEEEIVKKIVKVKNVESDEKMEQSDDDEEEGVDGVEKMMTMMKRLTTTLKKLLLSDVRMWGGREQALDCWLFVSPGPLFSLLAEAIFKRKRTR